MQVCNAYHWFRHAFFMTQTMHSTKVSPCFHFLLVTYSLFFLNCTAQEKICPFESIYQFGDSIADTGNLIRQGPLGAAAPAARLPYGETFFRRPTGRFSDGLLIIDFIVAALRLPLLNPYLDRNASFDYGANFAVAGSTALDTSFFDARGVPVPNLNSPLSVQLNWFRTNLNSICPTPAECERRLRRALVLVGEIGGNDINYALLQGRKSIQEIQSYIPFIVGVIIDAVREVIRLGAVRIVVPGNFPFGCLPIYLTAFSGRDPGAYDDLGCLSSLNELAVSQNNYLKQALASLRPEFPQVVILYSDYYTAFQSVLRHAAFLGFDQRSLSKACCGTGGPHNFDRNRFCGSPGVPVCPNPTQYIHWDGIHLTQEAYRRISEILVSDILSKIQCIW